LRNQEPRKKGMGHFVGDLAARMRAARNASRQSQVEIAAQLGVCRPVYSDWESGKKEIPELKRLGVAVKMAEVTGQPEGFFREAIDG